MTCSISVQTLSKSVRYRLLTVVFNSMFVLPRIGTDVCNFSVSELTWHARQRSGAEACNSRITTVTGGLTQTDRRSAMLVVVLTLQVLTMQGLV